MMRQLARERILAVEQLDQLAQKFSSIRLIEIEE